MNTAPKNTAKITPTAGPQNINPAQEVKHHMVQYGIFPNCTGCCDFCLRLDRRDRSLEQIISRVRDIRTNLDYVDWKDKFADGISLLGGEIYGYRNPIYEDEFMLLIEDIVEKVLKVSTAPRCRYSSVTNGMYKPDFLYRVYDYISDTCGMKKVDLNFSYDLKYRYKTEDMRKLALSNIQGFRDRYNYTVGIQMILTQYVIDAVRDGSFDIQKFLDTDIEGCNLVFLYPHPIHTGKALPDFFFNRKDFLWFMLYLEKNFYRIYFDTVSSCYHSGVYKYGGLHNLRGTADQLPVLADGKEYLLPCGHAELYRCYTDSDRCMLCDLLSITEFGEFLK